MKTYNNYILENLKYNKITEEEWLKLFKENCKNFSLDNDPLYRGDDENMIFGFHEPIKRDWIKGTYSEFFDEKEKDKEKYPVVRHNSLMGVGGGNVKEMIRLAAILADFNFDEEDTPVYRIIPFDNSKIVFCPDFDLATLDILNKIKEVHDEDFIMVEYTKNFKVPVDELAKIKKGLNLKQTRFKNNEAGFEFFTSSPCLMLRISNEEFLNKI